MSLPAASSTHMLPQQFLPVASQSAQVVSGQLAPRQRLKRGLEVVQALESQQRLLQVPPASHLWQRAAVTDTHSSDAVYDSAMTWRQRRSGTGNSMSWLCMAVSLYGVSRQRPKPGLTLSTRLRHVRTLWKETRCQLSRHL